MAILFDQPQTKVWENFTAIEKDFMEPLRQTLKVTRIQYEAELTGKRDEMTGNKSKEVIPIIIIVLGLRSTVFIASEYCELIKTMYI